MVNRRASHAGSWYSGDPRELENQLKNWISKAKFEKKAKAVIVPHAGYAYSAPTAAWSFLQLDAQTTKKIFVIGPSHHVYLPNCALPVVKECETPLGNLRIDKDIVTELHATGLFCTMDAPTDEEEHSIEMQLPFIAHIFKNRLEEVSVVPIMVGSIKQEKEADYAEVFAKYLNDPEVVFVISSDFCHWGKRFRYTYRLEEHEQIFESIEAVDREGMDHIASKNLSNFHNYLRRTKNTICGRNPICLLLATINLLEQKGQMQSQIKFLKYAQSSQVRSPNDSSVSYASAVCYL